MSESDSTPGLERSVQPRPVIHVPARSDVESSLRLGPRAVRTLPVRPRPYPQELLSSWLFRLAQANSQKLHSLTRLLLGEKQVWNRDIDRLADEGVLLALEAATGVSAEVLRLHTLGGLVGRVYPHFHALGVNRWILPLGVYHRTRTLRGLLYCPQCLAEHPAFLLSWRLSLSVVCPKHGTVLLDACPQCGSPVMPHRVDMAASLSKSLPTRMSHTTCFNCGFSLASASAQQAPEEVIMWQQHVWEAIEVSGVIEVRGVGLVPILEYLTVARLWLTLLTFGRNAERLRELVDVPVHLERGATGRSFDNLDLPTRLIAVQYLTRLFEGWPERVALWGKGAKIRRSTLLNDMSQPPVWYLEALKPLEYVNPRRPLESADLAAAFQDRNFNEQTKAILQGYAEGKSVRQLAQEFGVSSGTVRMKVTAIRSPLRGKPSRKES